MSTNLTKEEAMAFFAELYYGEHHIPDEPRAFGQGWYIRDGQNYCYATFDFNHLTRFVLMCHRDCIRGEIRPHTFGAMKIILHKRQGREGDFSARHPTIEQAIESFNAVKK